MPKQVYKTREGGLHRGSHERSANWRIATNSLFVAGCLTAVKAAGAIKILMLARAFGASDQLDAFLAAFLLPSFFADTIAGPLSTALIPALIQARERDGQLAMHRLIRSIGAATLALLCAGALLLTGMAPLILEVVASGFRSEKRELAQSLFYWLVPLIPMGGLSIVWSAALNSEERFSAPALAPGLTPVITIGVLAWSGLNAQIGLLAAAHLTGLLMELVWLGGAMRRHGLPLLPRWYGWDPAIRSVGLQHLPLVAVAAIGNGSVLVDQSMAALLGAGSVSALNFGTRLCAVLAGIAGGALSTAALPHFSRMASTADWGPLRRTLGTYQRLVLLIAVPVTALLIVLSPPLVHLILVRGAFTEAAAAVVIPVQRLSLLQLPALILNAVLLRLISSLNANHRLVQLALLALALNAALDFAFLRLMGLAGIPLATAIVQYLTLCALTAIVLRRLRGAALC